MYEGVNLNKLTFSMLCKLKKNDESLYFMGDICFVGIDRHSFGGNQI